MLGHSVQGEGNRGGGSGPLEDGLRPLSSASRTLHAVI